MHSLFCCIINTNTTLVVADVTKIYEFMYIWLRGHVRTLCNPDTYKCVCECMSKIHTTHTCLCKCVHDVYLCTYIVLDIYKGVLCNINMVLQKKRACMILIPNVCVYVCVNVCEREREGAADVGERSKKGTFAWVDTSLAIHLLFSNLLGGQCGK